MFGVAGNPKEACEKKKATDAQTKMMKKKVTDAQNNWWKKTNVKKLTISDLINSFNQKTKVYLTSHLYFFKFAWEAKNTCATTTLYFLEPPLLALQKTSACTLSGFHS